ncbi:MAG: HYR domain-containing protein, partial [Bacteroidota bacterium]
MKLKTLLLFFTVLAFSININAQCTIAPDEQCQDITVQLDNNGMVTIDPADLDNGSVSNCGGGLTFTADIVNFDCSNVGTPVAITLTVTDDFGNFEVCNPLPTVTVEDNTAPIAVCQNITVMLDNTGSVTIADDAVDDGSSDACGILSYSTSQTTFSCSDVGDVPVVLTVTDNNGNMATCNATVTVQDNMAPTASCQDVTVTLDTNGSASITTADIDNGSSDNCGIASLSVSPSSFDCSNVGPNTVTLTVTDVNGNVSSCDATVTVDIIQPQAICQTGITLELGAAFLADGVTPNPDAGLATLKPEDLDNGSTFGSCGPANLTISRSVFSCIDAQGNGSVNVTLTVTDALGNSDDCTVAVAIQDNTPPVFTTCPGDITMDNDAGVCEAVVTFDTPEAVDNCALETGRLNIDEPNGNDNEGVMFDITNNTTGNIQLRQVRIRHQQVGGTYETVVYAKDGGNAGTLGGAWNFVDGEGPYTANAGRTIQLQPGINVAAGATVGIYVANIAGNGNDFLAFENPKTFSNGQITINNPQEIDLPTGQTDPFAGANSIVDDEMFDGVVVYFVSTGNPPQTLGQASGTSFPVGVTQQEFIAEDIFGNADTCSFTVTVVDAEDPVAACQDVTIQLDANGAAAVTPMM